MGKQQGQQAVFGSGSKVAGYLSLTVLLFTLFISFVVKASGQLFRISFLKKQKAEKTVLSPAITILLQILSLNR